MDVKNNIIEVLKERRLKRLENLRTMTENVFRGIVLNVMLRAEDERENLEHKDWME